MVAINIYQLCTLQSMVTNYTLQQRCPLRVTWGATDCEQGGSQMSVMPMSANISTWQRWSIMESEEGFHGIPIWIMIPINHQFIHNRDSNKSWDSPIKTMDYDHPHKMAIVESCRIQLYNDHQPGFCLAAAVPMGPFLVLPWIPRCRTNCPFQLDGFPSWSLAAEAAGGSGAKIWEKLDLWYLLHNWDPRFWRSNFWWNLDVLHNWVQNLWSCSQLVTWLQDHCRVLQPLG